MQDAEDFRKNRELSSETDEFLEYDLDVDEIEVSFPEILKIRPVSIF